MADTQIGRLAMRAEGDWWIAYYAKMGTMDGALELGRVRMTIAQVPEYKAVTLECYKAIVGGMIANIVGADVAWPLPPQDAPEHEKSGRA